MEKVEPSRFFQFIWRFNAVVIFLAGLCVIGVCLFAAGLFVKEVMFTPRHVSNIVNIDEEQGKVEAFSFGGHQWIEGAGVFMIGLYSDQDYAQEYFSKSSSSLRNFIFIDFATGESHWLYDTHDYLIIDDTQVSYKEDGEYEGLAVIYEVVKGDTDGNERLTYEDKVTLAMTDINGREYTEIDSGVDEFIGHELMDKQTVALLYKKEGAFHLKQVSLGNLSVIKSYTVDYKDAGQPD